MTATPEFVTSGVSLEWKIRLEFVVPTYDEKPPESSLEYEGDEGKDHDDVNDSTENNGLMRRASGVKTQTGQTQTGSHPLLEEISRDDRGGLVMVAVENLMCESFEVAVPLRVYGAVCNGLERLERDEALEEGLVV